MLMFTRTVGFECRLQEHFSKQAQHTSVYEHCLEKCSRKMRQIQPFPDWG